MKTNLITLLSIIAALALFSAEPLTSLSKSDSDKAALTEQVGTTLNDMKEGQVLLLNIVPTGTFDDSAFGLSKFKNSRHWKVKNVMSELGKEKNAVLRTMTVNMGPKMLKRDPKTGKQLWYSNSHRAGVQSLIKRYVNPDVVEKDEFGFTKLDGTPRIQLWPPYHVLLNKEGKVLDRWNSYKNPLTADDVRKRLDKLANKSEEKKSEKK